MRQLLAAVLVGSLASAVPGTASAYVNWEMQDALRSLPPRPLKLAASSSPVNQGDIVVIPLKVCTSGCPLSDGGSYMGTRFYKFSQQGTFQAVADFFDNHADTYDVLVSFTMFHTGQLGGAYYMPLQNEVKGIHGNSGGGSGPEIYSYASEVGSRNLKGFVYMGDMYQCDFLHSMRVPLACSNTPPYPETAYSLYGVMGQEMGHEWGAFVRFKDPTTGTSNELLGRDLSHWSYLMDTAGSPMEGNAWVDNADGSFSLNPVNSAHYSELDQYLMGLRPAAEVSPFWFVRNGVSVASGNTVKPETAPYSGPRNVSGTRVDVKIDDVVAVEGARVPAADKAPKITREAFILFVVDGTPADAIKAEVAKVQEVRRHWRKYFYEATDKRMRIRSTLSGRDDYADFDFHITPEGWTLGDAPAVADGAAHLVPGATPGSNVLENTELELDTAEYKALTVTMTVPTALAGKGFMEWAPLGKSYAEGGKRAFQPLADGKPHTYQFSFGKLDSWVGKVGALRFQATDAAGDGKAEVLVDAVNGLTSTVGDDDDDAILDQGDNCRFFKNPDQLDADQNGVGDVCEASLDKDRDGVPDTADNCAAVKNSLQEDADKDGTGDACEPDTDGDGIIDDKDNCVAVPNRNQLDDNKDGVGDLCEPDADADGLIDRKDNCPNLANPDQADRNADGVGDACAGDQDSDGVADEIDNCPAVANADQLDANADQVGDACQEQGCGCSADASGALSLLGLFGLAGLLRRRRRA